MIDAGSNDEPPGNQPPESTPAGYVAPSHAPPGYAPPGYAPPTYAPPGWVAPQPMDPYYARFAPKPGSIPLRPLAVGDILDGSFRTIRRNPKATLGLSAVVSIIQVVILAIYQLVIGHRLGTSSVSVLTTNGSSTAVSGNDVAVVVGGFLAALLIGMIFSAVLTGMLTIVVTDDVLGRKIGIGEVWARTRPRLPGLIGLALIVGVLSTLGLFLFVAPGIWLWGIWALAVPAFMVEKTSFGGALSRSMRLVRGSFWRVWGIRVLGWLIVRFVTLIVQIPFVLLASFASGLAPNAGSSDGFGNFALYVAIASVGSIISTTFTAPVTAGIDSLLYVDQRMRREGLDIVLAQAASHPSAHPSGR